MVRLERAEINGLVIRFAVLPTAKEDANPLEGHGAHRCVMALAQASLMIVESTGPCRSGNRVRCELVKGLTKELRTSSSEVLRAAIAAGFGDWRDAAVGLQFTGVVEAFALCSKGGNQTGLQRRPSSRQPIKEVSFRMNGNGLLDLLVEVRNGGQQAFHYADHSSYRDQAEAENGGIVGGWNGLVNGVNALLDALLGAAVVFVKELAQFRWVDPLKILERGP